MNYAQKLVDVQNSINEAGKLTPLLDIQGSRVRIYLHTHCGTPLITLSSSGKGMRLILLNIVIHKDGTLKVDVAEEAEGYFKRALLGCDE